MRKLCLVLIAVSWIAGCADQSAIRLSNKLARVDVLVAPVSDTQGASNTELKQAAAVTLQNGFTHFDIVDADQQNWRRIAALHTAAQGQSTISGSVNRGTGFLRGSGVSQDPTSLPVIQLSKQMMIKMSSNGLYDARQLLGQSKKKNG